MDYLILFLEGIITFISPCLLPMLPLYLSYLAGQNPSENKRTIILNSIGFVFGFTLVFVSLGALAGTVGRLLYRYQTMINIVSGIIVIIFGLNFMGVLKLKLLNANKRANVTISNVGFFPSILFGIVFSIGWTPCVGAFLGSALMLAASSGDSLRGILMLLCFSLGLGIPFIASAALMGQLQSSFDFIKKNYRVIHIISGSLLVVVGILMATGLMGYFLSILTF